MAPRMALCVRELMRVCSCWTAILWLLWIAYSIVAVIVALYKQETKFFGYDVSQSQSQCACVCVSTIQIHTFWMVDFIWNANVSFIHIFDLFSSKQQQSFHFYLLIFEFPFLTASPLLLFAFNSFTAIENFISDDCNQNTWALVAHSLPLYM